MTSNTIDQLTEIEHRLISSWIAGDPTFHDRILAEDWTVVEPTGRVLTKADVLRDAFTGEREISRGQIDQIHVRDFGTFALVTGRTRVEGRIEGQQVNITLLFTDVFSILNGEWRCLASHGTFVSE
jgi:ketosteroid isomerase-like protein